MDDIIETVKNSQNKVSRPSSQEKQLNFYHQSIPNVFSHFNPSFNRLEKNLNQQY
jgi:hypothetical protein